MTIVQDKTSVETLYQLYEHSPETFQHSFRVGDLLYQFGDFLKFNKKNCNKLYQLGLFHDIGKLHIPKSILEKKGRLTSAEYEMIKKHTIYGKDIITSLNYPSDYAETILYHHENQDGSGYFNIQADNIPYYSKLIRIIDSFDTMFNGRIYRKMIPINLVADEIMECSNKQYDPSLSKAFAKFIRSKYSFNYLD